MNYNELIGKQKMKDCKINDTTRFNEDKRICVHYPI